MTLHMGFVWTFRVVVGTYVQLGRAIAYWLVGKELK